jgi:hypothetical protein
LFDLNNDPQEQHDLSNEPTGAAIIMQSKKQLEMWLQACVTRRIELGLEPGINSIHQFTAEQARELEALGYVGGE